MRFVVGEVALGGASAAAFFVDSVEYEAARGGPLGAPEAGDRGEALHTAEADRERVNELG